MEARLRLDIQAQPDDTTCGPTSLHAVYRYYGDAIPLDQVIAETRMIEPGGTLTALLACHALRRGYSARIYSYNLALFDPTWLLHASVDIPAKLRAQAKLKEDPRLRVASEAYIEYLRLGGTLRFEDLTADLIRRHLKRGIPILTGLSATYLYHCAREIDETNEYDDVRGTPVGHFVVLCGYDKETRRVLVADPLGSNPTYSPHMYEVSLERLVGAILLGVLTFDAGLLLLEPKKASGEGAIVRG